MLIIKKNKNFIKIFLFIFNFLLFIIIIFIIVNYFFLIYYNEEKNKNTKKFPSK